MSRPRPTPPTSQNHVWAIDFVFDACADGRQIKCLTVLDEYTHESLAIDVAGSIRSYPFGESRLGRRAAGGVTVSGRCRA